MSEAFKRLGRLLWSDRILLPLSWVSLGLSAIGIVVSFINSDYDVTFWIAIGIAVWSLYDIIKYKRGIRRLPDEAPNN